MTLGSVIPKQLKNACKHFSPMEGLPEFFTTLGPRPSMTKDVNDSKAQQQKQPHHNHTTTSTKPIWKHNVMTQTTTKIEWCFLIIFVWVVLGKSLYDFRLLLFVVLFYFCFALCYRLIFARSFCSFSRSFCLLSRLFNPLSSHFVVLRLKQKKKRQNRQTEKKTFGRMDWLIDGWRDKRLVTSRQTNGQVDRLTDK